MRTTVTVDARLCIAYLNIELRGPMPVELRAGVGGNVFGCDICQDVCPWNRRAPVSLDPCWQPRGGMPDLERLGSLTEDAFREFYKGSPISRARYGGFLRNVATAMGNTGDPRYRPLLARLAESPDPAVAEHARWALEQLE